MGHLSFFTAVYVGGGAIVSTVDDGEDTSSSALRMACPQQQRRQQRRRRPNVQSAGSKSSSSIYVVALLLCMTVFAAAQEFDCNCSPVTYTFKLKLGSISCPDPPIAFGDTTALDDYFGPGVLDYTCNPDSGLPLYITSAQFIPLAGTNQIPGFVQTQTDLELENGDTLTFNSPDTPPPPLVDRVQLTLTGVIEDNVEITNTWTIQFTNECGILVLQEGTELGWVVFDNLERPSKEICPRDDPPPGSYSYAYAFSKAGKGGNKAGKNVNSKYDGYSYGGKSGKGSKSSKGSRRILRTAGSANEEHERLPPMTLKDESVVEESKTHDELPLRRRRLHV